MKTFLLAFLMAWRVGASESNTFAVTFTNLSPDQISNLWVKAIWITNYTPANYTNYPSAHVKLKSVFETNWTTVSVENWVQNDQAVTAAVYRPPLLHQVGTVSSNRVLEVEWGNKWWPITVETNILHLETRTTSDHPPQPFLNATP